MQNARCFTTFIKCFPVHLPVAACTERSFRQISRMPWLVWFRWEYFRPQSTTSCAFRYCRLVWPFGFWTKGYVLFYRHESLALWEFLAKFSFISLSWSLTVMFIWLSSCDAYPPLCILKTEELHLSASGVFPIGMYFLKSHIFFLKFRELSSVLMFTVCVDCFNSLQGSVCIVHFYYKGWKFRG